MAIACDLARLCPTSQTAFSVGAVIVSPAGEELARGYSREGGDAHVHAEEAAIAKARAAGVDLVGATVYSSLEPCARRASRPTPCAQLLINAGVSRVVSAWQEPDTFVPGADGTELLEAAGVTVSEIPEFTDAAQAPNEHLLQRGATAD